MHIITYLLNIQSNIKLYHWLTTKYPRHIASDDLHKKLHDLIDEFVEVYIGKYSRPTLTKPDLINSLKTFTDTTITTYLDSIIAYLTKDITAFIKPEDVDLYNIRDEMVAILNKTKYLFTLV